MAIFAAPAVVVGGMLAHTAPEEAFNGYRVIELGPFEVAPGAVMGETPFCPSGTQAWTDIAGKSSEYREAVCPGGKQVVGGGLFLFQNGLSNYLVPA